jgi:REP element-mobilizing transposase RayT
MPPLQPDTSYHIFNHANGFENVFREAENYRYFLEKYRLYISPIAETYAWCLMPNHFHLVVRIRKRNVIEKLILNSNSNSKNSTFSKVRPFFNDTTLQNVQPFSNVQNFGKGENLFIYRDSVIEKYLSKQFANFFSCYTQSFNKSYKRMGSLFVKNFKREPIEGKQHFFNAVIYTHRNPIHHRFRDRFEDWDYSSFFEIIHNRSDIVEVDKLLKTFGGREVFIEMHRHNLEAFQIDDQPEN